MAILATMFVIESCGGLPSRMPHQGCSPVGSTNARRSVSATTSPHRLGVEHDRHLEQCLADRRIGWTGRSRRHRVVEPSRRPINTSPAFWATAPEPGFGTSSVNRPASGPAREQDPFAEDISVGTPKHQMLTLSAGRCGLRPLQCSRQRQPAVTASWSRRRLHDEGSQVRLVGRGVGGWHLACGFHVR